MTTSEETGGPVFPNNFVSPKHQGMTLRDYFAAQAMKGIQSRVNWDTAAVARLAYEQADDMLEARND